MTRLLFVCGFPSGGTDLTKTVLNAHPDVYINGEMPFLKDLVQHGYNRHTRFTGSTDIKALQDLLTKLDVWHNIENIDYDFSLDMETKRELVLEDVLRTCFSNNASPVWGNKTPQNTENIELLLELFPSAYFLIVTRDVRDVCLSWRNKWGRDVIWCAAKWAERMRKGWVTTQSLPAERYLFVKFEDLLSNTEMICKGICQFLGVPFSDRMLEHHKYTTRIIDGKIGYGQPIKKDNRQKWKEQLPVKTVKRIEEIAYGTMYLLGYEMELAADEQPISSWETWHGIWNDSWALLLIGNRASQQNGLGRRFQSLIFEFKKRLLR